MTLQSFPQAPAALLQNERPQDGPAAERLIDRAFGPGRFTKVSERVREFALFAPDYSFCAWEEGRLVGVVRQWRARVGEAPLVFLGPLAVDADQRLAGLGGRLVERGCEAAAKAGEAAVLLVGDEAYFSRFGFSAAAAAGIVLPGPVDYRRVLLRPFRSGARFEGLLRGL